MPSNVLGRTNQAFPAKWLRLVSSTDPEGLVEAALRARTVLDISTAAALWGGFMRGTDSVLMACGGSDVENATDEAHAANLLQAHLIQTLSAVGREYIEFYFLSVRKPLEEFQISGALQALDSARDDGHIRYLGLHAAGNPLAALSVWQFHDAFDVIFLPDLDESLIGMARERRVGIVGRGSGSDVQIVDVADPSAVLQAIGAVA